MRRQTLIALVAFAVVASVSVVGATGALAGSTPHDGTGANYTVVLPNEKDHYPGDQNEASASIWHLSAAGNAFDKTSSPEGLETIEYIKIWNQDVDFSACGTSNTAAFGVDRGNDDSGTHTDDDLLKHRENSQFNKHSIVVDFFDDESLAGTSTYFNDTDQIVAVQQDCYTMPSEPGWYQINARINGTGYNGNHIDEAGIESHYFYICECASEQEAREKLGPPPSEEGSGGGASTPEPTATPAPQTTTPQSTGTPEPKSTGTPEPKGTSQPKSTATPNPDGDGPTATPGDKQNPGTPSQTPGTAPNATQSPGGDGTGNGNGTGTGAGNGNTGTGATATNADGGPLTPTAGAGPGFGALVALLGLLAAALLATRE